MSLSHKDVPLSSEHKKSIGLSLKGHITSDTTKAKISLKNKGNKSRTGLHNSKEHNKKISNGNKGKKRSDETKKVLSNLHQKLSKERPDIGQKISNSLKNFYKTEEGIKAKQRISENKKGKKYSQNDFFKTQMKIRKQMLSSLYLKLKENKTYTDSWNNFQKWLKVNTNVMNEDEKKIYYSSLKN